MPTSLAISACVGGDYSVVWSPQHGSWRMFFCELGSSVYEDDGPLNEIGWRRVLEAAGLGHREHEFPLDVIRFRSPEELERMRFAPAPAFAAA